MRLKERTAEEWRSAWKVQRHCGTLSKGLLPPLFLRFLFVFLRHRCIRTCDGHVRADVLNSLNYAAMIGHARWEGRLNRMRKSVRRMIGHRA